jgi:hypothetical protein
MKLDQLEEKISEDKPGTTVPLSEGLTYPVRRYTESRAKNRERVIKWELAWMTRLYSAIHPSIRILPYASHLSLDRNYGCKNNRRFLRRTCLCTKCRMQNALFIIVLRSPYKQWATTFLYDERWHVHCYSLLLSAMRRQLTCRLLSVS